MLLLRPSIAFMSSGVNSKSRTWNKGRITLTSPLRSWPPPGTGGLSSWMETRRGDREAVSVFSFQVNNLGLSAEFSLLSTTSTFLLQFSDTHTQVARHQSPIFPREFLLTEDKQTKINFFANKGTVGQPGQNTCT